MAPNDDHGHSYHPKDAINSAITSGFQLGTIGALFAGAKASLTKQNIGPFGAINRYGGIILLPAIAGATFSFTKDVVSNLREKNDWKGSFVAGFVSGAIVGLHRRSIPAVLGIGVASGVGTAILTYSGGEFRYKQDVDRDVFAEREALRKNWRSPVEQTLGEIGEGRGIYGPGYAERRKQRIKDNYGIEVPSS